MPPERGKHASVYSRGRRAPKDQIHRRIGHGAWLKKGAPIATSPAARLNRRRRPRSSRSVAYGALIRMGVPSWLGQVPEQAEVGRSRTIQASPGRFGAPQPLSHLFAPPMTRSSEPELFQFPAREMEPPRWSFVHVPCMK